jgi:hypothetical protein
MTLVIRQATQFRCDIKRLHRQGNDLGQPEFVVITLVARRHYRRGIGIMLWWAIGKDSGNVTSSQIGSLFIGLRVRSYNLPEPAAMPNYSVNKGFILCRQP